MAGLKDNEQIKEIDIYPIHHLRPACYFIFGILLSGHAKNVSLETVQQNIASCEGINTLKKGTARDMRKNLNLDEVSLTGLFTIAAMV